MNRRDFMLTSVAAVSLPVLGAAQDVSWEVTYTEAEWRRRLTFFEFQVLREGRTERAFSSPLVSEWRPGSYHCKGCHQMVYMSEQKYDAGTGWPSFAEAIDGRVLERRDLSMNMQRIALKCMRCGSHLGHLQQDARRPSGIRHSANGIALIFVPDPA